MKLYYQYPFLLSGFTFVSSAYKYIESSLIITPPRRITKSSDLFFSGRPIGTSSIIVSSGLIRSHRFSNLTFCQDLLFWHSLASLPDFIYASTDRCLVSYSVTQGRTSRSSIAILIFYYYKAASLALSSPLLALTATILYLLRGFRNKLLRNNLRYFIPLFSSIFLYLSRFARGILRPFYLFRYSILFDLLNRTNTSLRKQYGRSYHPLNYLDIHYVAVNTDVFCSAINILRDYLDQLGLDSSAFQFVDLGCGKCKSLYILLRHYRTSFSQHPLVGIETSSELLSIASSNLSCFSKSSYTLVLDDASSLIHHISSPYLVIYAYNPFGLDVLIQF